MFTNKLKVPFVSFFFYHYIVLQLLKKEICRMTLLTWLNEKKLYRSLY